jgi:hypothetical protein
MKMNRMSRLLVALLMLCGIHKTFATIFNVVNLAPNAKIAHVVFHFTDQYGDKAMCFSDDMQYKDQSRVDSETSTFAKAEGGAFDIYSARLVQIGIYYFFGDYNAASAEQEVDWEHPVWINKVNWKWSGQDINDRRRWTGWKISNLEGLGVIPALTSKMVDNTVLVRIYSHGKCEIVRGNKLKTLQGVLRKRHVENV